MTVAAILKSKGRDVATARPSMTLLEAARTLADRKIGALVITDRDHSVIGILSERDLVRVLATIGAGGLTSTVGEVMSHPVRTCQESDTIEYLMAEMTARRLRHLPVVEEGRLTGIISIGDVVKARIAETEMEAAAMKAYIATA